MWEVDLARWLKEAVLPDGCAVLVTSRDLGLCKALASYVEPLSGLPVPDGLRLLANLLGELGRTRTRPGIWSSCWTGMPWPWSWQPGNAWAARATWRRSRRSLSGRPRWTY